MKPQLARDAEACGLQCRDYEFAVVSPGAAVKWGTSGGMKYSPQKDVPFGSVLRNMKSFEGH